MGQGQIAAGGQGVGVGPHEGRWILVVGDEVQDRAHQDHDRLGEVEQPQRLRVVQDAVGVGDVFPDAGRVGVAGEDVEAVGDGDVLVVDVDHAGVGHEALGDLVHVADRGQAGAEVEELADPVLDAMENRSAEERTVVAGEGACLGQDGEDLLGRVPVDLEVVGAVEEVVVHSGDAGPRRVHHGRTPVDVAAPLVGVVAVGDAHDGSPHRKRFCGQAVRACRPVDGSVLGTGIMGTGVVMSGCVCSSTDAQIGSGSRSTATGPSASQARISPRSRLTPRCRRSCSHTCSVGTVA
ncbi:hypothetical protein JJ691_59990 [Kutzneria sp. CA-103260]|nr:hypothetical protein JJ691_59990 [Kutzneria sp. CA-103260]